MAASGRLPVLKESTERYCLSSELSPTRRVVAVEFSVPPRPLVSLDSSSQPSFAPVDWGVAVLGWVVNDYCTIGTSTWSTAANWSQFGRGELPDTMNQVVFTGTNAQASGSTLSLGANQYVNRIQFDTGLDLVATSVARQPKARSLSIVSCNCRFSR